MDHFELCPQGGRAYMVCHFTADTNGNGVNESIALQYLRKESICQLVGVLHEGDGDSEIN